MKRNRSIASDKLKPLAFAAVCLGALACLAYGQGVASAPWLGEPDPNAVVRLPPVNDPAVQNSQPSPPDSTAPAPAPSDDDQLPLELPPMEDVLADEELAEKTDEPIIKLWESSIELGIDGSSGNSETFNIRSGFDTELKTKYYALTADLNYRRNAAYDEEAMEWQETANRAFLDWRLERLFHESPWSAFVHGTVEYDEFREYDLLVSVDLGISRELLKSEVSKLTGRFGGGFSQKIGSIDDRYVPEMIFGLDFERRLSKRQKLKAKTDYMPDVTDFTDFRLNTEVAWEVIISEENHLSLKTSAFNRYDSTPGNSKANDVDYSVVILWNF